MALIVDAQATQAMDKRGRRGRSPSMIVCRVSVPQCGTTVAVRWAEDSAPPPWAVTMKVGNVPFWVDRRIARYARYYPVVITAVPRLWRSRRLAVTDPLLMVKIAEWERTHPLSVRSA